MKNGTTGEDAMDSVEEMSRETSEAQERVEDCRAQAGLYHLLGRVLEQEVDAELLALLRGELGAALVEMGVKLPHDLLSDPVESLLERLAVEYTGLFSAPGSVSPFASVFATGAFGQEQCDRAEAAYRAAGFVYERRQSGEFPDHIGTMLSFVGTLFDIEAAAVESEDEARAETAQTQRETFILDQLGEWGPGWCRRAAGAAQHPFYAEVLDLVERVLWEDIGRLAGPRRLKELAEANGRPLVRMKTDPDFRKASGL